MVVMPTTLAGFKHSVGVQVQAGAQTTICTQGTSTAAVQVQQPSPVAARPASSPCPSCCPLAGPEQEVQAGTPSSPFSL